MLAVDYQTLDVKTEFRYESTELDEGCLTAGCLVITESSVSDSEIRVRNNILDYGEILLEVESDVNLSPIYTYYPVIQFKLKSCEKPVSLYAHGMNQYKCLDSFYDHETKFSPAVARFIIDNELFVNQAATNEVVIPCLVAGGGKECYQIDDPRASFREDYFANKLLRQEAYQHWILDDNGKLIPKKLRVRGIFACPYWHVSDGLVWDLDRSHAYKMSWEVSVELFKDKDSYGPIQDNEHLDRTAFWNITPEMKSQNTYTFEYSCIYPELAD